MSACPGCGASPREPGTCPACGYRRLPLDRRWTLRERYAYDYALRAGGFSAAWDIVRAKLTTEEVADAERRGRSLHDLFTKE